MNSTSVQENLVGENYKDNFVMFKFSIPSNGLHEIQEERTNINKQYIEVHKKVKNMFDLKELHEKEAELKYVINSKHFDRLIFDDQTENNYDILGCDCDGTCAGGCKGSCQNVEALSHWW